MVIDSYQSDEHLHDVERHDGMESREVRPHVLSLVVWVLVWVVMALFQAS